MTPEQFWEQDVWLAYSYKKAHLISVEQRNQELWMQGLYNFNAFSTVIQNLVAKKGQAPQKYLDKPIRITPMTEQEREEEKRKAVEKTLAFFMQGQTIK